MSKIMFYDIEVDNREYFGRFASPHHPDNYVVMEGYAVDDGKPYMRHYKSKEEAKDWFHIPEDVWLIVCHNLGFELYWLLTQQPEKVYEFIKRGGQFACTQMAEYLLSGQQHLYPELEEIAPKYGGSTKIDAVKLLWQQGKLTSEIDPTLLGDYLIGEEGDIENTRHVFWGQYEQLLDNGQWDMFLARCDSILYNAQCEANGLYVNREVAYQDKKRLEGLITETLNAFKATQKDFPKELEFTMTRFQMSAYLFGGPIVYRKRVPRVDGKGLPVYEKYEAIFLEDGSEFSVSILSNKEKVAERLAEIQEAVDEIDFIQEYGSDAVRYSAGKNKGKVKVTRVDSDIQAMVWDNDALHMCEGLINLDELPTQFTEQFKKDYIGAQKLRDGTPVVSTKDEAIKLLLTRREIPDDVRELLELLSEFQEADKELGTFYLKEEFNDKGEVTKRGGMLQYLTDENYIHHQLNSCSTATTRLSSTRPNLQNTPSSRSSNVKGMFESRYGAEGKIVSADYSNIEVIVLAALSEDENLKDFVLSGKSMHTFNLANWLDMSYEEANAIVKDESHPRHEELNDIRDNLMKPFEFSANYGASPAGVAYASGGTLEQAQAFLDYKARTFPKVQAYHEHVAEQVEATTKQFREVNDAGNFRLYGVGYMQMPCGTRFTYRQHESTVYTGQGPVTIMKYRDTQMKNYQTQGTAALVIQVANGRWIRHLIENDFYGGLVKPINTVHDENLSDMHDSVLHQACADKLRIMEGAGEYMREFGYEWDLPFPVGISAGLNWKDQHDLDHFTEVTNESKH